MRRSTVLSLSLQLVFPAQALKRAGNACQGQALQKMKILTGVGGGGVGRVPAAVRNQFRRGERVPGVGELPPVS
jgi:hypothetical protein